MEQVDNSTGETSKESTGTNEEPSSSTPSVVNIGVLGAAWIVPMALTQPAALLSDCVKVVAIAARDERRGMFY